MKFSHNICREYIPEKSKGEGSMVTLAERNRVKKEVFPKPVDDFEKYLKQQRLKTTFNGIEVAEFSWYKKLLGMSNSTN